MPLRAATGRARRRRTDLGPTRRSSSTTRGRSGARSGEPVDVIDIHEEPFALATAEVLLLRSLRRQRAPYVLYSAQNIDKTLSRALPLAGAVGAASCRGVSVCNAEAGRIVERKGSRAGPASSRSAPTLSVFTPATASDSPRPATRRPMRARRRVVGFAGRLDRGQGRARAGRGGCRRPGPAAARRRRRSRAGRARGARARAWARRTGSSSSARSTACRAPEFYRSLDVLAVPSLTTASWVEQFGRVALEAMACGTPVVVSDSGALPEVVGAAAPGRARGRRRRHWPRRSPGSCFDEAEADRLAAGRARRARPDVLGAGRRRLRDAVQLRRAGHDASDPTTDSIERTGTPTANARSCEPRGRRRGLRPAGAARARPVPLAGVDGLCASRSSTTRRRPTCGRSSSAPGPTTSTPAATAASPPASTQGSPAGPTRAPTCCSLNPDAAGDSVETIDALRARARADDRLASVGPVAGRRRGATVPGLLALPLAARHVGRGGRPGPARVASPTSSARCCCCAAEALEQVGRLDDERFFLYAEETDWAYRATRARMAPRRGVDESSAQHAGAGDEHRPAGARVALPRLPGDLPAQALRRPRLAGQPRGQGRRLGACGPCCSAATGGGLRATAPCSTCGPGAPREPTPRRPVTRPKRWGRWGRS